MQHNPQKDIIERFDKALKYADRILPLAHSFAPFNVSLIALYETNWAQSKKEEANDIYDTIQLALIILPSLIIRYYLFRVDKLLSPYLAYKYQLFL